MLRLIDMSILIVLIFFSLAFELFPIFYSAQVFEGHPFLVEAGVSIGGKDVKHVSSVYLTNIPKFEKM